MRAKDYIESKYGWDGNALDYWKKEFNIRFVTEGSDELLPNGELDIIFPNEYDYCVFVLKWA